ncbi:hypothetical protein AQUCO_08400023v1 [Aquilegia coerulea]|uniref:Uncharacterized protein n=1 Tax=Aquilegia coerulea TaxID=218851 RepID=A0A2G5C6Q7_AQUCA|nr:hypothetical protein AQUCO_08400023v1 [Aquilegia coerulea]
MGSITPTQHTFGRLTYLSCDAPSLLTRTQREYEFYFHKNWITYSAKRSLITGSLVPRYQASHSQTT